jgi:hypothetical protein
MGAFGMLANFAQSMLPLMPPPVGFALEMLRCPKNPPNFEPLLEDGLSLDAAVAACAEACVEG